jgi:hypothetical protein
MAQSLLLNGSERLVARGDANFGKELFLGIFFCLRLRYPSVVVSKEPANFEQNTISIYNQWNNLAYLPFVKELGRWISMIAFWNILLQYIETIKKNKLSQLRA